MKIFGFLRGRKKQAQPAIRPTPRRVGGTVGPSALPDPPRPEAGSPSPDDELSGQIDSLFDGGRPAPSSNVDEDSDVDRVAVYELFSTVASHHARPVKNLIFELKRGTATREWLEICRPVVRTLTEGAESMNLPEIAAAAAEFADALQLAAEADEDTLDGPTAELILESYESMCRVLPPTFALGEEVERRESIIIHALLKQIPGIGHVTFERLYGASLTSLEVLFGAQPDELSATTGIPVPLCRSICDRIGAHVKSLEVRPRAGRHEELAELLSSLRRAHERFVETSEREWLDGDLTVQKRESRYARQHCALQIEVILAEMGELDVIESLRRLSFDRRIEAIDEFLAREDVAVQPVDAGASSRPEARG